MIGRYGAVARKMARRLTVRVITGLVVVYVGAWQLVPHRLCVLGSRVVVERFRVKVS